MIKLSVFYIHSLSISSKYLALSLLVFFLLFSQDVSAVLDSCSASVDNHTLNSNSVTGVNLSVQNQSDDDAAKIVIIRPGGNYELSSEGVEGCGLEQGDDSISIVSCSFGPSQALNVPINVTTTNASSNESWTVRMIDSSGDNDVQCGGDLSSTIQGSSGGSIPFSISGVSVSGSVDSATISWTTDSAATSYIEYGTSDSYGSSQLNSNLTTFHSISISGLSSSTTYHYRLTSVDGSNNSVSTGNNTFTTSEQGEIESTSTSSTTTSSRVTPTPTLPPDVTAPSVRIAYNFAKPVARAPLITGSATDDRNISRVEYSIDGGGNWYSAQFSRSSDLKTAYFSFTPPIKEDGNYSVIARAVDFALNSSNSQKYVLIFDRIPPKIGGSIITSGPQIILANSNGVISLPSHSRYTILFSSIGGATDITLLATPSGKTIGNTLRFIASKNASTSIWTSDIQFDQSGDYEISVDAIDGADNRTVTALAPIHILESGKVISGKAAVKGAVVSVYYYDTDRHAFFLWNGKAYSQNNPAVTDDLGSYSFTLPKGKYYIEVKAKGYKDLVSDIFSFQNTTVLNSDFDIAKHPFISFLFLKFPRPFVVPDTQKIELKKDRKSQVEVNPVIGKTIGQIHLLSNGRVISKDFFRGKRTILGFTNSWLPQTQLIIKDLRLMDEFQTAIVMPNESDSFIQTYKKRGNYPMPFISDVDGTFLEFLNMRMLPGYVEIDEEGVVKDVRLGVFSKDTN